MQSACYNQLAVTLYTTVARQQSRKQHHACAVVFTRCIAVASCCIPVLGVAFQSDPAICKAGGLCCCVIHECCHKVQQPCCCCCCCCCCSAIFVGSRAWSRVQPLLRYILVYFCKYFPATAVVLPCFVRHACVCAVCHAWIAFFSVGSPRFCSREAFFAVSATTKAYVHELSDKYATMFWRDREHL